MLPDARPDHPNAWTTDSVRSKSDISYLLSAEELSALDDALNAVKASGLAVEEVTTVDFPLGIMEETVARWIKEIDYGKGLVLLQGIEVSKYSKEDCALIFWGLGAHMGEAQSQSLAGDRLGHVVNLGGDNPRYRAYQNSTELALHTDATDIVGMMCLVPASEGGLSGYAGAAAIYNELAMHHPQLLPTLCEGFHYHLLASMPRESRPSPRKRYRSFRKRTVASVSVI